MPKIRGNVSFHYEFKENGIKDGKRWIKYLGNTHNITGSDKHSINQVMNTVAN
jgi:hypothetical protein